MQESQFRFRCFLVPVLVLIAVALIVYWSWQPTRYGDETPGTNEVEENERHALDVLAVNWIPPPEDSGPERLFPIQIEHFQRTRTDDRETLFHFHVAAPCHHAIYEAAEERVEVLVYRAGEEIKESLRRSMIGSSRRDLSRWGYNVCKCAESRGRPEWQYHVWWSKGWLVIVYATGQRDQEAFLKAYLLALGRPGGQI